jgi:hypothetical protein
MQMLDSQQLKSLGFLLPMITQMLMWNHKRTTQKMGLNLFCFIS